MIQRGRSREVPPLRGNGRPGKQPAVGELSGDRGYELAAVSGVETKSGRSTNGHFVSKLFSEVATLDRLTH